MEREQQKIPFRRSVKAEGQGEAPESVIKRAELSTTGNDTESSSVKVTMEAVVSRDNLKRALARVVKNAGVAGVDEMTVKEIPEFLKTEWLRIKDELLSGGYQPNPVKRIEIPKPDGGVRKLGIPTVLDRQGTSVPEVEPATRPSATWAACIKRIYEIDPLECPKCKATMRVIAFITDEKAITAIMKSQGIAEQKPPKPMAVGPPPEAETFDPGPEYW